ncbi:MAG: fibronectin type III domain-containing protein, partial [Planctomycetes bacterium]|nr:fibronectin type III domain-containing protein [Planctomycetota bacterium]
DDGATGTATTYDIRYATTAITTDAQFTAATVVVGEPAPAVAGTVQTVTVSGLSGATTYYFAMKTADEVPNWSALSNNPSGTTLDGTAPAAVSNLSVTGTTATTADLQWTSPGDDGATGTATTYDIRYATTAITTDAQFTAATVVVGEPAPAVAGTVQTMTVSGLSGSTTYYFAMKTADEVPNWSALSNNPSGTTLDVTAPAAVSNLAVTGVTATTVSLQWTSPGDDAGTGTATTYDIRYAATAITTDAEFTAATTVTGEPAPAVAGTVQTMTVTGLVASTTYYFAVKTADEVPNWSAVSNSPTGTTSADISAPAAVGDLAVTGTTSTTVDLQWTAPGDDGATGTATTYDIRYAATAITTDAEFTAATAVTGEPVPSVAGTVETMTVTGLFSSTTYYFAVKTADEVPNWSAVSNSPSGATLASADATAPAAVTDLAVIAITDMTATLQWTSPGDDGATGTATAYDVRYAATPITTDAEFTAATVVVGEPAPAVAGTVQSVTVTGLTPSTTYYFAIKTADEAPNWSAVSNSPTGTTSAAPDTTPPAAVSDLTVTGVTSVTVGLQWTSPGDDGATGTATTYDVRYAAAPITTDAQFTAATAVTGEPTPAVSGTLQTMTVTGLTPSTTYYFAIKTQDEAVNPSAVSNSPTATTEPVDALPPVAVTDLVVAAVTATSATLQWTAPGDDGSTGTATTYDIRYASVPILSDADFTAATSVVGEPAPAVAGTVQSMVITGLASAATYYFAIKIGDEVPNWSALSNNPVAATSASGSGGHKKRCGAGGTESAPGWLVLLVLFGVSAMGVLRRRLC